MTEQITVPRETWDALQQALKDISEESYDKGAVECANHALTAANAVSAEPCKHCGATHAKGMNTLCDDGEPQVQGEAAATVVNALLSAAPLLYKAGHPQESAECNKALLFFTGAAIPAHPQATEPAEKRKLYECTGCGHLHEERPSSCDCGENPANTYNDWTATPAAPEAKQ